MEFGELWMEVWGVVGGGGLWMELFGFDGVMDEVCG